MLEAPNGAVRLAPNKGAIVAGRSWATISASRAGEDGAAGQVIEDSGARAINEAGDVVGSYHTADPSILIRAYLWSRGATRDLGMLGGRFAEAYDINARGQVVGWAYTVTNEQRAFLWENGTMRELDVLPGTQWSRAHAINDAGKIAGTYRNSAGDDRAVVWENGRVRDLDTLGGPESAALMVSARGQVIGMATTADSVPHAAIWDEDDNIHALPSPSPGIATWAGAADDSGRVVGWVMDPKEDRAPLWRGDSLVFVRVGPVGRGGWVTAEGINNRGQVVVNWTRAAEEQVQAYLWQDGHARPLGTLGGRTSAATDINDRGQVVGTSDDAQGRPRAFLWESGRMRAIGPAPGESTPLVDR